MTWASLPWVFLASIIAGAGWTLGSKAVNALIEAARRGEGP